MLVLVPVIDGLIIKWDYVCSFKKIIIIITMLVFSPMLVLGTLSTGTSGVSCPGHFIYAYCKQGQLSLAKS